MSAYPPPPGSTSGPSTPNPSNLPVRPPPPAGGPRSFKPAYPSATLQSSNYASAASSSFTGFAPRALASHQPYRATGPQPPSTHGSAPTYTAGYQQGGFQDQGHYGQHYQEGYANTGPPQIRNPFAPTTAGSSIGPTPGGYGAPPNADPDMDAQIAQWQSAYVAKDDAKIGRPAVSGGTLSGGMGAATSANSVPVGNRQEADQKTGVDGKLKTVQRSGGGQSWSDSTLLEWDPAHFRIFVGNLAGEVTDDSLLKAFNKYTSIQKARVIRDKRTTKSKGYGFVSFSDGDDYFRAARDMQGKYIGSHPVLIKKSTTEIKAVNQRDPRQQQRKGGKGGGTGLKQNGDNGVLGANTGAGIGKKQAKTKGGLKILG